MTWPPTTVWWETIANAVVHRVRLTVIALVATVLLGGLAFIEMSATTTAIEHTRELRTAGSHVYSVRSVDPQTRLALDAAACHSLLTLPQVIAAGGVIDDGYTSLDAAPGTPLRHIAVTGSAIRVFDPDAPPALPGGGWLAASAGHQIGVPDGAVVTLDDAPTHLAWANPDRRHPNGASLLVAPSASPRVDECWFEVHPGADSHAVEVAATLHPDAVAVIAPLLPRSEFTIDPLTTFSQRPSRWLWAAVGAALGLGIVAVHWFTRSETALYRLLGLRRSNLVAMHTVTAGVITATAALTGVVAAALLIGTPDTAAALVGMRASLAAAFTALCTTVIGSLAIASGSVTRQLKDR